jgi:hypothetical protein
MSQKSKEVRKWKENEEEEIRNKETDGQSWLMDYQHKAKILT